MKDCLEKEVVFYYNNDSLIVNSDNLYSIVGKKEVLESRGVYRDASRDGVMNSDEHQYDLVVIKNKNITIQKKKNYTKIVPIPKT
jgi:hypothetical protein